MRSRLHHYAAAVSACALTLTLAACSNTDDPPTDTGGTHSTETAAGSAPRLLAYEFPGGMIEASVMGDMYTRVDALVGLPSTPGPHPVAVVTHGSYPSCIDVGNDTLLTSEVLTVPWEEGCGPERRGKGLTVGPDYVRTPASMAYLARELAAQGVAVVIPDVNTKERLEWGEASPELLQTNLVKTHLGLLKQLNDGEDLGLSWGADVKGQFDLDRVALIGHSSGAEYALQAGIQDLVPGVEAVAAIEPSYNAPMPDPSGDLPPTMVLGGQCDEQIPASSIKETVRDLGKLTANTPVIAVELPHATHIGMLTGGGTHKIGLVSVPKTPACRDAALLDKGDQQSQTAALVADFVSQALAGSKDFVLHSIDGVDPRAESVNDAASVTVSPTTSVPLVVDPKSIDFTISTHEVLPPKPDNLKLWTPDGGHI